MTFALNKEEKTERDRCASAIKEAHSQLADAIDAYNLAHEEFWQPIETAIAAFTKAKDDAESFAKDVASRLTDEFVDKSDKWQESEKGQQVQSMIDVWENFEVDCNIDIEEPTELEIPDLLDESEIFAECPESPGG